MTSPEIPIPDMTCRIPDGTTDFLINCVNNTNPWLQPDAWLSLLAAIGTLAAVGLSLHFGNKAHKNAVEQTNAAATELEHARNVQDAVDRRETFRDNREENRMRAERRKHAEQVAAWLVPNFKSYFLTEIKVANHSEFPIWDVELDHPGVWVIYKPKYSVMMPGQEVSVDVGRWAIDNFDPVDNPLSPAPVAISFTDSQFRSWKRTVGDNAKLVETTKDKDERHDSSD
ncbi:hypothetical protein CGQ24_07395 [Arthrobacter sp. 7749]|nr:hypothetical protein CGQ24_07395 [Arthrobacter sp. 7749]